MNYEYSCGAVVFTRVEGQPHYVLVRAKDQPEGCHGFPKGHMEAGETEEQTALREILEETGLRVKLLPGFRAVTEYQLPTPPDTRKRVVFFLAEYDSQEPVAQESELAAITLAPWPQALELTEFGDSKKILTDAHNFLTK
jgi:ADP-ribose pyrophosphatase YjhB (NUDIX family)